MIEKKLVAKKLENKTIRLEPLTIAHADGLAEVVKDGELWKLNITSAPMPTDSLSYINTALNTPDRIAFAVIDKSTNLLIGTTS